MNLSQMVGVLFLGKAYAVSCHHPPSGLRDELLLFHTVRGKVVSCRILSETSFKNNESVQNTWVNAPCCKSVLVYMCVSVYFIIVQYAFIELNISAALLPITKVMHSFLKYNACSCSVEVK